MKKKKILLTLFLILTISVISIGCENKSVDLKSDSAKANKLAEEVYNVEDLKIGDYIEFGKYYENPILWRVIHIDENGNPLIFSDRIISLKVFDASGPYHKDEERQTRGSNYWKDSNLGQWLNSDEKAREIKWIQNTPNSANTITEFDTKDSFVYDIEKGFLADGNFTEDERSKIKSVSHKVLLSEADIDKKMGGTAERRFNLDISSAVGNYDEAYYEIVEDKVFLLSIKEVRDYVLQNKKILGEEYYIGKPTESLVKKAVKDKLKTYFKGRVLDEDKPFVYWLRTPMTYNNSDVITIGKEGDANSIPPFLISYGGVRPALFLDKSNTKIYYGKGTESKPFLITKK